MDDGERGPRAVLQHRPARELRGEARQRRQERARGPILATVHGYRLVRDAPGPRLQDVVRQRPPGRVGADSLRVVLRVPRSRLSASPVSAPNHAVKAAAARPGPSTTRAVAGTQAPAVALATTARQKALAVSMSGCRSRKMASGPRRSLSRRNARWEAEARKLARSPGWPGPEMEILDPWGRFTRVAAAGSV